MKPFSSPILLFLSLLLCLSLCPPVSAAGAETAKVTEEELLASLYEADIPTLREAMETGLLSPVTLTKYYLDRIAAYNKTYNCFITLAEDALAQAEEKERLLAEGKAAGRLFGIPLVVKDNIDVAGLPTTNGHSLSADTTYTPTENAHVTEWLLAEGAIILGKTNMATDAQSARYTISRAVGETVNAYQPGMVAGGSSGGSAVAVCCNFALAGLGTDTNSSLRIPAVLNGCLSLRCSRGLVSTEGTVILNSVRDTPGVITRNVTDQAILLDIMTDGTAGYADRLKGNALRGLKVGVLKELSYPTSLVEGRGESDIDPEVAACFERVLTEISALGAEIVTVSMKNIFSHYNSAFGNDKAAVSAYYADLEKLYADNGIDLLIFPSYLNTPLEAGKNKDGSYKANTGSFINNSPMISPSVGTPEIALTVGYHSKGPGIGLEIAALKGQEQLLLDVAYTYTAAYDHRIPPVGIGEPASPVSLASLIERCREPLPTGTETEKASSHPVGTDPQDTAVTTDGSPAAPPQKEKSTDFPGFLLPLSFVLLLAVILLVLTRKPPKIYPERFS